LKFKIISSGRKVADPASSMVDDYLSRIRKFIPIDDIIIKPGLSSKFTERIEKERDNYIIALDERGKQFTSNDFSVKIDSWMNCGKKDVVFVIGPAEGLPQEVKKMADALISLSKMTLPHRFARMLLTEQIYRGFCILKNIPYHK
jgi:23S rRNA (pseudouridine1915-N3)-methyltransferase